MAQPSSSSLRSLSPLLVVCLWLQKLPSYALPLKEESDVVSSKDFWTCIAALGNQLQSSYTSEQLAKYPNDQALPIENDLLGFSPLFPETEKTTAISPLTGFLPLSHSIQLLSNNSRQSNTSDQDSIRKVARFLLILRNLAAAHSNKEAWPLLYDEITHTFTLYTPEISSQNLGVDLLSSVVSPNEPEPMDDFADDEIVYTGSLIGNMEAPLQEDVRKQGNINANPYTAELLKRNSTPIVDRPKTFKPSPTNIKPPPGFSGPPSASSPFSAFNATKAASLNQSFILPSHLLGTNAGNVLTPGVIGTTKLDTSSRNCMVPNTPVSSIPPGFESLPKIASNNREAVNMDFNQLSQWPPSILPNPDTQTLLESPWSSTANPFVGRTTGTDSLISSALSSKSMFNKAPDFPFSASVQKDESKFPTNVEAEKEPAIDENEFQFLGSLMFDPAGFSSTQPIKDSPPTTRNPFIF